MKDLQNNQAALILELSESGEVSINITSPNLNGVASVICQTLANKLMQDESFRDEIMKSVETKFTE